MNSHLINKLWVVVAALLLASCSTYKNYADAKINAYEAEKRRADLREAPQPTPPQRQAAIPQQAEPRQAAPQPVRQPVRQAQTTYKPPYDAPYVDRESKPFPKALYRPRSAAPTQAPAAAPVITAQPVEKYQQPAPTLQTPAQQPQSPAPVIAATATQVPTQPVFEKTIEDQGIYVSAPSSASCQARVEDTALAFSDLSLQLDQISALLERKGKDQKRLSTEQQADLHLAQFTFNALRGRTEDVKEPSLTMMDTPCQWINLCKSTGCTAAEETNLKTRLRDWDKRLTTHIRDQLDTLQDVKKVVMSDGFDSETTNTLGLVMSDRLNEIEEIVETSLE